MAIYYSRSARETENIGFSLAKTVEVGSVVALFGELGAGKTAFVRGFARGMGIDAEVTSPTFALVNEYRSGKKALCHFDMYRITGWDDLYSTGYFDYLDAGATSSSSGARISKPFSHRIAFGSLSPNATTPMNAKSK